MNSNDLLKAYNFDADVLPPFIDIHRKGDEEAWVVVSNHLGVMNRLFTNEFIDTKKIRYLAEQLSYIFDEMSNINVKLAVTYHNWVFTILDYYIKKSIEIECYEIAENLTKFTQIYKEHEPI